MMRKFREGGWLLRPALFFYVRPSGRTCLEVEVLYTPAVLFQMGFFFLPALTLNSFNPLPLTCTTTLWHIYHLLACHLDRTEFSGRTSATASTPPLLLDGSMLVHYLPPALGLEENKRLAATRPLLLPIFHVGNVRVIGDNANVPEDIDLQFFDLIVHV